MARTTNSANHHWRFFRAGGVDQPRLDTGADLMAIEHLDQKLWVALSCPVKGLDLDERTLALIDSDKDGRVRAQEIIGALRWLRQVLNDTDLLTKCKDTVPLDAINDETPEGKIVVASARHLLEQLGKEDATEVSLADVLETQKNFTKLKWNGDGIVPPESISDAGVRDLAKEIIASVGGEADRSGLVGVSQAKLDLFWTALTNYEAWQKAAEADAAKIMPLGKDTSAAVGALHKVRAKVDDYFARCRVAAYDPRALAAVNRKEDEYLALAARDMTITAQEVAGFPLTRVEAAKPLDLVGGVNPAWRDALLAFHKQTVAPILKSEKTTITEADWTKITETLAPYEAWATGKKGGEVEKLGLERVRAILAGPQKDQLKAVLAKDKAVEPELNAITEVERLLRYSRDIFILVNNFVSFTDFYSRRRKAVFQAGTLYIDGRACDLCVRVEDAGKHSTLAILSKTYLAYVECARPSSGEKMTVVCAMTAGDSDHLMVGRNGIFYDRKGRDWDASITKIVDNPISIGQAFWAPYKRALRYIEEQVAKRAAAADAAATQKLTTNVDSAAEAVETGKPKEPPKKFDIGILAALAVAIGGITTMVGALLSAFLGLGPWMPAGFVAVILGISGPSMLIAWMKLRQRNLGPILDANGWAVNGRVKINIPFGAALTSTATLPEGAERSIVDPYAEKKSSWPKIVVTLLILGALGYGGWKFGYVEKGYYWARYKITGKAIPGTEEKSTATSQPTSQPAAAPDKK